MEAMEGLIPFIFKAIKQRRTRSNYYSRCSSTGSSRGRFLGARVEDSSWDQQMKQTTTAAAEREMMTHRRHRSLEELAGEVGSSPHALRRGRSVRIFSCIGGM